MVGGEGASVFKGIMGRWLEAGTPASQGRRGVMATHTPVSS